MKVLISFLVITLIVVSAIGYNFYTKKHRSALDGPSLVISAVDLFYQFEADEKASNERYLDKLIEVTGQVGGVLKNQDGKHIVILKRQDDLFGVSCTLEHAQSVHVGSTVTVRGFCMGYLSDVVIGRAEVINN